MAQARDKYSRIQYPVYVRPQVPRLVIFSSLRSQDVITRAGEYPHYSRTMQDNKACSTAEATGLARIMFVRYGHVPFGLNGDLSGPLTELSKFDEWDKTTRGKVSYIRKLVQGHAWDSSSWIKKRIGGEVSQDGCLTLITNWDLHRRIFLLVPPGENDDQRIAREAEVTEYETGIVTLQGLVKASHRHHWRTTSDKATLAKTTAQRTKLEADREFYAARKDVTVEPLLADVQFDTEANILNALIVPLHQRDIAVRIAFWRTKLVQDDYASFLTNALR